MNVSKMNDKELLQLFKNANRMLSKGPNVQADSAIAAIEDEWKKRLELARSGLFKSQQPEIGMLATLGYHVGSTQGEPTPIRRMILKNLFERQLPMVESPAYTDEWGAPNSSTRYWKLVRFLGGQLSNPRNENAPNMEKAMIEWSEDLEWVEKSFSHLIRAEVAAV